MAIQGYNNYKMYNGEYFASEGMVAQPGIALVLDPSGAANATAKPGDSNNTVMVPSGLAGELFVGILFDEVIDWDRTQCCFVYDQYRAATTPCRPLNIIRKGDVCTDMLDAAANPTPNADAYVTAGGLFTEVVTPVGPVGKFRGVKDANGWASIHIDV